METNELGMTRTLYIGNLSPEVISEDVWKFFDGHGQVKRVFVSRYRYGFVEFQDASEAEAARFELNWRDLKGRPVRLHKAASDSTNGLLNSGPSTAFMDRETRIRYFQTLRGPIFFDKFRHRLIVTNLTSRCRGNLKEMMSQCGKVTYASAHRGRRRTGIVCFATRPHLQQAIKKYQWEVIHGRRINLIDDTPSSPQRSPAKLLRYSPQRSPVAWRRWSVQSANSVPLGSRRSVRRDFEDHTTSFQTTTTSIRAMGGRGETPTWEDAFKMPSYADFKSPDAGEG